MDMKGFFYNKKAMETHGAPKFIKPKKKIDKDDVPSQLSDEETIEQPKKKIVKKPIQQEEVSKQKKKIAKKPIQQEEDSEEEEEVKPIKKKIAKKPVQQEEYSDEEEEEVKPIKKKIAKKPIQQEDDSEEEEEEKPIKKKIAKKPVQQEDDSEEEEEVKPIKKKIAKKPVQQEESEEEEDSEEEEEEEEEEEDEEEEEMFNFKSATVKVKEVKKKKPSDITSKSFLKDLEKKFVDMPDVKTTVPVKEKTVTVNKRITQEDIESRRRPLPEETHAMDEFDLPSHTFKGGVVEFAEVEGMEIETKKSIFPIIRYIYNEILEDADAIRKHSSMNIQDGQVEGKGFVYLEQQDISVQGATADKMMKDIFQQVLGNNLTFKMTISTTDRRFTFENE